MTDAQTLNPTPMRWLGTLFNPAGTSSKLEFTRAWTLLFFIQVFIVVVIPFLAGVVGLVGGDGGGLGRFATYASPIVFTVTTFCSYIIHTRRLRDGQKSSLWAVLILLPLFLGFFLFYTGISEKNVAYEKAYQERIEYVKDPDAFEAKKEVERAERQEKRRAEAIAKCEAKRAESDAESEPEETCEEEYKSSQQRGNQSWGQQSQPEYRSPTPSKIDYILEPNLTAISNAVIPLSALLAIWSLMWVARVPFERRSKIG